MRFKNTNLIILTLITIFYNINIYASEDKSYEIYLDSTLLYSRGISMEASSSSSNWNTDLPSNSKSYIAQISYGETLNYSYFRNCSFSNIGLFFDYNYLDYIMGDIQSVNIGIDFKILWVLKLQFGIGHSFSNQTYTINHGFNWNNYTQEDRVIFNGYSGLISIGTDIPLSNKFSFICYLRSDGYSEEEFFTIGGISLSKNAICFGIKMILWTDQ